MDNMELCYDMKLNYATLAMPSGLVLLCYDNKMGQDNILRQHYVCIHHVYVHVIFVCIYLFLFYWFLPPGSCFHILAVAGTAAASGGAYQKSHRRPAPCL